MSAFTETKNLFAEAINYTTPLTFSQWMQLADECNPSNDMRAAALFVQFFEQITLAWYKVRSYYTLEEDGVSTVLQYLQKNVPVIAKNPKRYNAKYIYQVAFNCLYCICHDLILERERFNRETSNLVPTSDGDLDLFDLVADCDSMDSKMSSKKFWELVYRAVGEPGKVVSSYVKKSGETVETKTCVIDGRVDAVINKLMGGTAGMMVAINTDPDREAETVFGVASNGVSRIRVSKDFEKLVIEKIRAALVAAGLGY